MKWYQLRYCRADQLLKLVSIKTIPVDILRICNILEVPVFWNKTMREDGLLYMNLETKKAEIHVKQGAPKYRFRFTVAHELGHLLQHDFDELIHRDFNGQNQTVKEREANSFAARLLIPTENLLWHLQCAGGLFKEHHLKELAIIYNVSYETMYYRVNNMNWLEKQG